VHHVRVELKGYRPGSRNIVLSTEKRELSFQLERGLATLRIHVTPPHAQVFIDGKERGHIVEKLEVEKEYRLEVRAKGYYTEKRKITLNARREVLDLKLEKRRRVSGQITIGAQPWAIIFIDDKEIGESPLKDLKLSVGTHTIIFRHPDFKTIEKKIKIKKGKNPDLNIYMGK